MANKKFSDKELLDLVDRQGLTQPEAAKCLGVTKQAVNQRLKELRTGAVKLTATKGVEDVFSRYNSAVDQFRKISESAHQILDLAMAASNGDAEATKALADRIETTEEGQATIVFKLKDPRELALKAMSEVRNQLKLQVDILHVLSDLGTFAEFKDEVLEAIGEVDPEVRNRILDGLNRRRAIASAVQFQG